MLLKCALGIVWITINYGCVKFEFNNKLFQYDLLMKILVLHFQNLDIKFKVSMYLTNFI